MMVNILRLIQCATDERLRLFVELSEALEKEKKDDSATAEVSE